MSNEAIAVLQLVAAVVVMAANVMLAVLTYRYVRLTAGMLDHMRGGQAASVVIDLTIDSHFVYLNVENVGSTAATNIVFEELSGVNWSEHGSVGDLRERGISYLPAHRTMRFWLGIPDWDKVRDEGAPVRVALRFNTEGTSRRRDFVIDMMQYAGTTAESAPEDRIVDAIERLRDAQQDRGLFSRLGVFEVVKKPCVMCAELIPEPAKICSHCGFRQSTEESAEAESGEILDVRDDSSISSEESRGTPARECDVAAPQIHERDGVREGNERGALEESDCE
jgi:hypothetical protein